MSGARKALRRACTRGQKRQGREGLARTPPAMDGSRKRGSPPPPRPCTPLGDARPRRPSHLRVSARVPSAPQPNGPGQACGDSLAVSVTAVLNTVAFLGPWPCHTAPTSLQSGPALRPLLTVPPFVAGPLHVLFPRPGTLFLPLVPHQLLLQPAEPKPRAGVPWPTRGVYSSAQAALTKRHRLGIFTKRNWLIFCRVGARKSAIWVPAAWVLGTALFLACTGPPPHCVLTRQTEPALWAPPS